MVALAYLFKQGFYPRFWTPEKGLFVGGFVLVKKGVRGQGAGGWALRWLRSWVLKLGR